MLVDGDERTTVGGVGAVAGAVGLAAIAGVPGAVAGVAVLVVWFAGGDLPAFAVGVVALGATTAEPVLLSAESGLVTGALVESVVVTLALAPLVLGRIRTAARPLAVGALVVVLWTGLAMLSTVPVLAGETTLLGAGILVTVFVAISYGLHRYALLVSGVLQRG